MTKSFVAVYPGFFDPFTLGHLNIVERAVKVFDRVVVAIAEDSIKKPMFTSNERLGIVREILTQTPNVEVETFGGLLVTYLRKKHCNFLLRGIRTVSDFEFEYQMALANKDMAQDIETFFMMTEGKYSYLSSTVIKEIARLGGDISNMVPPLVAKRVKQKYAS
jgi:pantetheine-phosphate adenylyltransferase